MNRIFKCRQCGWQGTEMEIERDCIETCMGDDDIEMCPECGSYELVIVKTDHE